MRKFKLFFLTLVALLGAVNASGKTVYIQPGNWSNDNAVISVNVWGDGSNVWVENLTEVETGIFKATIGDGKTTMAVVRGTEANKWQSEGAWNQTGDITITDGKLYKLYDYDNSMDGIYVGHGVVEEDYTEPVAAGYVVDFNTEISTSSHDFAVAPKWKHIVDVDDYYDNNMSYSYKADEGRGGSGALWAGKQKMYDNEYNATTTYDMLVTPVVSGSVTIYVKPYSLVSSSNKGFLEFWSLNGAATEKNTKLATSTQWSSASEVDWEAVTITVETPQRIGIRAQYVYIDDFSADAIDTTPEAALVVSSVMDANGNTGTQGTNPVFEQQPDGNMKVILKVSLSNTGDVDFVAGSTENYTLTAAQTSYTSGSKTYYDDASIAIPEDIAAGETKTFDVEFTVPYISGFKYWYVKENVTGTTSSSCRYATSVAYEPKFVFRVAESTSSSSLSGTQSFGLVSEETTNHYEIANTGTAPLIIKSITLPEGFTSANLPEIPAEGLTIAKGATQPLDITLPITTTGAISGTLTIVYLDKNNTEQTYTLAFSGNVLSAGTWAADFSVASSSEMNYPVGSIAEGGIRFGTNYVSADNYNGYLYSYTSSSYATENNKFITPKLHANAADKLTFDVSRDGYSSSSYNLKVYVSTDRKTWGDPVYSVTAADLTSSFQTKEISFDESGDYYVAFAIYGVRIDNIIGLTKVDVAHDLYIKSVTWPDASIKSGASQSKPSVDIIPLTDETAEAYTVKYVSGETVLAEGAPVALTASATRSKTFSFTWTPNVESTTVYENTKVVFDFGGGVVFETETFDLTVTNEPKFHFLKTLPSSKFYEPTDYTTPITFGKTNTAESQSFYVYNWGSAPLTVKSISVPTGFTVTPAEQFNVAAFNETDLSASAQAVEITFSATEAGIYSGDMVITYLDGANVEQTFNIAVSGTKLNPTKFYATFGTSSDDSNYPAGSLVQANVSLTTPTTDNAALISSSATKNLFITPKLVSTGETMQFDACQRSKWYKGKVKVYSVSDHIAAANTTTDEEFAALDPTLLGEFEVSSTSFEPFNFDVPAGESYIAFKIEDAYVDEIYGLTPAAVAHDWKIASSNIPAEAMQNVAATATINVLNFGLAEEAADSYTVTAYVDGKAAAEGTAVAIPMNHKLTDAGTALSVNFMSPKVGTFPVYLEVKAGGYSVVTDHVDVTFTEEIAIAGQQVGTKTTTSSNAPFYTTWMDDSAGKSMTDLIYTPEQLAAYGITAGAKITSITFVGTPSGTKTINSLTTDAWIAQEAVDDFTPGSPNKESMTHVVLHNAETVTFTSGTPYEFKINLVENPIIYDGTSGIRIYTNINGNGLYQAINFDVDGNYKNAYYAHGTGSFSSNKVGNPVAYFALEASVATFTGTVKDGENAPVEGANILLVSNDGDNVQYSGVTAADGKFSINVIQASRTYDVTVTKDGLPDAEATVAFGGENQVKDFFMIEPLVVTFINGAAWENVYAYTYDKETAGTWPGTKISKTGTKSVCGVEYDVYTFKLQTLTTSSHIIFNNGNSGEGNQTGDLDFADGQEYYYGDIYYTVAGAFRTDGAEEDEAGLFGSAWDTNKAENEMTKNSEGIYELEVSAVELVKGTIKFKVVVNHGWDGAIGIGGNNCEKYVDTAGSYNVTFKYNPAAEGDKIWVELELIESVGIRNVNTNTVDGDIYTVGGVRSEKLVKGQMNIIRTSDGKVRKVYVK